MTAILSLIGAAVLVAVDQITKALTVSHLSLGESFPLWENVLHFTYVQNDGAVFGSLSGKSYLFNTVTVLICLAAIVLIVMRKLESKWLLTATTLILAGGIGNLIDRFRLKYVIDFVDVRCFGRLWCWVFNFADCCVVVGCGILLVYYLLDWIREARAAKAVTVPEQESSDDDA